jgi:hypothetical protein
LKDFPIYEFLVECDKNSFMLEEEFGCLILISERMRVDLVLINEANSITRIQNFLVILILSSKLFELLIGLIQAMELSNKMVARFNSISTKKLCPIRLHTIKACSSVDNQI